MRGGGGRRTETGYKGWERVGRRNKQVQTDCGVNKANCKTAGKTDLRSQIHCRRVARMLRVWRTHHPCADFFFFFFFLADAFLDCACHEYKNTDEEKRAFWPVVYV